MKNNILPAFLIAVAALFTSCQKDPCKNVDCGTQGYCVDGDCACNAGWIFDANGKCNEQDLCYGKNCANGSCNPSTGQCDCNTGWTTDANGFCTVQDLCAGVNCGPNSSCDSQTGQCVCNPGYTLNSNGQCVSDDRTPFIGTWYGTHRNLNTNAVSAAYTFTITKVPSNPSAVYIDNFFNSYCNSQGQPLRVIGYVNDFPLAIDYVSSTCSNYVVEVFNQGFFLQTATDLKADVKITIGFTDYYYSGNYVPQ